MSPREQFLVISMGNDQENPLDSAHIVLVQIFGMHKVPGITN